MRRRTIQLIFGVLVFTAGVLLLLEATGLLRDPVLLWAVLLAAAGGMFWIVFLTDRPSWWAAIPGAALLGTAVVSLMELDPAGAGQWTEVPFLAALGIGFWAVYLRDHQRWWAIIPGGVLLTLAVITGVAVVVGGPVTGAILLFGMAGTFALVAVLPTGGSRHRWAWILATVLATVALLVLLEATALLGVLEYLWPLAVIGAGVYLLGRVARRRPRPPTPGPLPAESPPAEGGSR